MLNPKPIDEVYFLIPISSHQRRIPLPHGNGGSFPNQVLGQRKRRSQTGSESILCRGKPAANASEIGRALEISPSTVGRFLSRLATHDGLYRKLGRPSKTPPLHLVQELEDSVVSNPFETRCAAGESRLLTPAAFRRFRHSAGIYFYRTVPMPGVKAIHRQKPANFAARMLEEAKTDNRPIVFTDESIFVQYLSRPGV
jgi:hypothetical protein